jgi:hypothetical protein
MAGTPEKLLERQIDRRSRLLVAVAFGNILLSGDLYCAYREYRDKYYAEADRR